MELAATGYEPALPLPRREPAGSPGRRDARQFRLPGLCGGRTSFDTGRRDRQDAPRA